MRIEEREILITKALDLSGESSNVLPFDPCINDLKRYSKIKLKNKGTDHYLGEDYEIPNSINIVCEIDDAKIFNTKKEAQEALSKIPLEFKNKTGFLPPKIQPIDNLPDDF